MRLFLLFFTIIETCVTFVSSNVFVRMHCLNRFVLQHSVYEKTKSVPLELESVIDETTFSKSRAYAIDKSQYGFYFGLYSQLESTVCVMNFEM